jgi:lipid II:glycine glycyltransferase (peptidoglycan interpeptide bridge formation enzyme)
LADLNILILGKLDATKTAQQMNQQLDELQSKLKTLNIDLKIDQNVVNQMMNMNNSVQQTSQLIQQQTQDYVRQGAVIQATSEKIKIAKVDSTMGWVTGKIA